MATWNATGAIDCCCESIELGRCFGSNGEGIAECGKFINDTVAFCHSIDDPSDTFGCHVQDVCPQIGEDWIPYKPLLDWGLIVFFLWPCYLVCTACHVVCCCVIPEETTKELIEESERRRDSSITAARTIVSSFSGSIVILACSQIGYETTLYVVIGFLLSTGLVFSFYIFGKTLAWILDKPISNSTVTAENVYQDLSTANCLILTTFVCQLGLLIMYIFSLMSEGPPDFSDPTTYFYYLLGAFIQIAVSMKSSTESKLSPIHSEFQFWVDVCNYADKETKEVLFKVKQDWDTDEKSELKQEDKEEEKEADDGKKEKDTEPLLGKAEEEKDIEGSGNKHDEDQEENSEMRLQAAMPKTPTEILQTAKDVAVSPGFSHCWTASDRFSRNCRLFVSILINYCGKQIVLFLLPIQLAHSGSAMDFILNSIAAYFIIEMDDYPGGKTMLLSGRGLENKEDERTTSEKTMEDKESIEDESDNEKVEKEVLQDKGDVDKANSEKGMEYKESSVEGDDDNEKVENEVLHGEGDDEKVSSPKTLSSSDRNVRKYEC
mmetsp:Transcript_2372/g.5429  ORF Transcript_2372/g.5429 Transcript_2372/m.5429 type:complete len:548 (+) Transcript_2372:108-1751(+)